MKKVLLFLTALFFSAVGAFGQQRTITGKVVDQNGNPIPYATVQIQGTNQGTTTDQQGNFTIDVPANATLHISYIGYQAKNVPVDDQSHLQVTLQSSAQALNEVVVTALGVQRQEREVGYSTQTVSSATLNEFKPVTIGEGLTDKVPGLQINTINNGVDPGIRVVLRGYRHLNADNQALIVVDGVPVRSNFLSAINPNDVADVTVLKGASAAALYGAEASNGVIVITTKHGGENGKPLIEFNHTTLFERISYMPELQTQFAPGSGEQGPYPWDPTHYFNDPYTGFIQYVPYENQNYGMPFNNDPALGYIGGPLPDGSFFKTPFKAVSPDPRKAFFQTGYRMQNNLSYSGGDNKNSYYLSLQDVTVKGVLPRDQARRTSAYFAGKRTYGIFSAQFSLGYEQRYSNTVGPDFAQGRPVYWNLLNQGANVPLEDPRIKDPNSPFFLDAYYNAYYPNPWWQIYNSRIINRTNYFTGSLTLNLNPFKWLNLNYQILTQFTDFYNNSYVAAVNFSPWAASDPWGASNTASSIGLHQNGSASYTNANARNISQNFLVTLSRQFGDFSAKLILGNVISEKPYGNDYSSYTTVSSNNLFIDNFYNVAYRLGELSGGQGEEKTRLISGLGDLTLGYKDFAFIHGNFRRDWTSLLAKGHNAYNFWDIDASLVFTDAFPSVFKSSGFLSYGKIRAAYSVTGQISIGPYHVQNVFDVAGGFPYGSQAGLLLDQTYNNPNLEPEKTIEREIGLELGLWNSRINLNVDYYHSNTLNQTFPANVSSSTGYTNAFINAGNVMSEGVEAGVEAVVLQNNAQKMRWTIRPGFTWNGSKVLYMPQKDFFIGGYTGGAGGDHAVVGYPFPVIEATDIQRDPQGRPIIDPANGYPMLTDTQRIIGQINPKYLFDFSTSFSWKNFTLSLQLSYRGGNVFDAVVGNQLNFTGTTKFTTQNGRQNFIFPNSVYYDPAKNAYVPNDKYYTYDGNLYFWTNSPYVEAGTTYIVNAAFWKLRNISLSYDFGDLLHNVHWIKGLTLTLMGKNLLMWRPSQNVWTDPEFNYTTGNAQGISNYDQLPPTRQFGASLDVKF